MKKNVALIAVRKGSQRIKNKNIRNFCGTSLLEIKVKQAMRCAKIDEVFVSSDCQEMLSISKKLGAKILSRPEMYCSNSVAMNDVYEFLAKSVSCENIVYLHVTSPLLKDETLYSCITRYEEYLKKGFDSLATVESVKKYLWHGEKAVNYDPNFHPRSQDLPEYTALNFAVNIIKRDTMIINKNILGRKFYPYVLDEIESIDVDNFNDMEIASYFYKKKINE